jgi:DNA mismatch endonuclease (patch repair protein)
MKKTKRDKERDAQSVDALQALGWDVMVIWECEFKDRGALEARIKDFLSYREMNVGRGKSEI